MIGSPIIQLNFQPYMYVCADRLVPAHTNVKVHIFGIAPHVDSIIFVFLGISWKGVLNALGMIQILAPRIAMLMMIGELIN